MRFSVISTAIYLEILGCVTKKGIKSFSWFVIVRYCSVAIFQYYCFFTGEDTLRNVSFRAFHEMRISR